MNHYVGLLILAVAVATIFALVDHEDRRQQVRHCFVLLLYMVVGSLAAGWIMSYIPW